MKNLIILWLVLLLAISGGPLFASEELYLSDLGTDNPVWDKQFQTAEVFGCYTKKKERTLAKDRANLVADNLSALGVKVTFVGIEKNRRGLVKIIYVLKPSDSAKTSQGFWLSLWEQASKLLPGVDQPTKIVILMLATMVIIILAIVSIKKINRFRKTWKIKRQVRKENRHKLWLLKQEAKHKTKAEKIAARQRLEKSRIAEAEAKQRAQQALADKQERIRIDNIELDLRIKEYELAAKQKTFSARKKAEQEQHLHSLNLWPTTIAELENLAAEVGKDEERSCPHCLADLQAKLKAGNLTEDKLFEQIGKLPKIKYYNVKRHFGRAHAISEETKAELLSLATISN